MTYWFRDCAKKGILHLVFSSETHSFSFKLLCESVFGNTNSHTFNNFNVFYWFFENFIHAYSTF